MALTTSQTAEIVKKFGRHDKDTSSPEVQIALLTAKLNYLNDHFNKNSKDHHSRTGLMKMVGRRRRLLEYLNRTNGASYSKLISDLGIRK